MTRLKCIVPLLIALALSACAAKTPPIVTPTAGSISAAPDAVIVAGLGALQAAAIIFAPVDGFSQAETTAVVNSVGAMTQVVIAAKVGWVSAVDVLFAKLPALLSASTMATLQPWVDAIQASISAAYASGLS